MIPKSVQQFSEKIMLKQDAKADDDSKKRHLALVSRFRSSQAFAATSGARRRPRASSEISAGYHRLDRLADQALANDRQGHATEL